MDNVHRDDRRDLENGEGSNLLEKDYLVKIKASDASTHNIYTSSSSTVAELKALVLEAMGKEGKFARLLYAGRMLQPDGAILGDLKVPSGSWVHVVVSDVAPRQTGAGPAAAAQEEQAEEDEDFGGRGFDRLRADGMTTDQIRAIRATFSSQVDQFLARAAVPGEGAGADEEGGPGRAAAAGEGGESALDRRLRAEEEWMDAQGELSEFGLNLRGLRRARGGGGGGGGRAGAGTAGAWPPALGLRLAGAAPELGAANNVGTMRDFAWGFFMGFFLGFIMLFWLWERSVPERQKMGLLAGVTCQLSLNLLKRQYSAEEAQQQQPQDAAPQGGGDGQS